MKTVLVLLLLCGVADAAPALPAQVTLDQALALERDHSSAAIARHAAIDVAAADVVGAGLRPNPQASVDGTRLIAGDTASSAWAIAAEVDWPLLINGQRSARMHAAERAVVATRSQVAAADYDAALEVRRAFVALLAAQARATVRADALDDIRHLQDVVAGRAKAGAESDYDKARIALEVAQSARELADAKAEVDGASGDLAAAVGIPDWRPAAVGDLAPSGYAPTASDDAAVPAVQAASDAALAADASLDAAKREGAPTPSLVLGVLETETPHGWAGTIGVQVPLPVFDRAQGQVAQARANARAASDTRDAIRDAVRLRRQSAAAVLADRKKALADFDASAAADLIDLRRMAETAYTHGQGDIVQLLDALGAISDAKLGRVDLVAAVMAAEVEAQAADGAA